jgi:hypothetical protein
MNVLSVIGCVKREEGTDVFVWEGTARTLPFLLEQRRRRMILDSKNQLVELFPPLECVGFASLTIAFLMFFPAMRTFTLNLKELSSFFSVGAHHFKTTLCKLYQITQILEVIGITKKTVHPSEVQLAGPFLLLLDDGIIDGRAAFAIDNILVHSSMSEIDVARRRAEFNEAVASNSGPMTMTSRSRNPSQECGFTDGNPLVLRSYVSDRINGRSIDLE